MSDRVVPPQLGKQSQTRAKHLQNTRRQRIVIFIAVIATLCTGVLAFKVIPYMSNIIAFRREQVSLPDISPFDALWLEINPDYVGWLKIDGTNIDFPVVCGSDNEEYLTTTFFGYENIIGAIFMDYRCRGKSVPNIIIYGHEAQDVSKNKLMFGGLQEFLDEKYLSDFPIITFIENDNLSEFEIFSARMTDIRDPAYHLDFSAPGSFEAFLERNGAPADTEQIITLSTCVGANSDRRMLVQGALKRIVPVKAEHDGNGWRIIKSLP